ncbi:hypothetical protein ACFQZQ_06215 [Lysobacter koreensis]|uniref:Uncharacterized protein n=1 Tax=Lysobacter koreensis TaxID=266122 RepID=A0ABW2YQU0_9GAMM
MLLEWVAKHRLNEYSDVLGLLITIVGFAATLWAVWRSRRVAAQALAVANKVRDDLRKVETVAEFSSAMTAMEEVKRLHRKGDLDPLPERYSALRRSLISLRASSQLLTDGEQSVLQSAITQFAGFERRIEKALTSESAKVDFAKMNRIVSSSMDQIHAVLIRIKTAIGDGK